jgi:hypothetical protein
MRTISPEIALMICPWPRRAGTREGSSWMFVWSASGARRHGGQAARYTTQASFSCPPSSPTIVGSAVRDDRLVGRGDEHPEHEPDEHR